MNKNDLIIVTGSAGFIGSCMVGLLNQKGFHNIIMVDDFSRKDKELNYTDKKFIEKIERDELFDWLKREDRNIKSVFHLGARTDTTEFDYSIHERLNVEYSKSVWNYCVANNIPLVYASSAATYGGGEWGYKDDHDIVEKLQPLNAYGISKNEFDKWALKQTKQPPLWIGLKFFNVYGPNEYHKGRMASVIFHSYNQLMETGKVKLFRSHKPEYADGGQRRDFIYVNDVIEVCFWMMEKQPASGLYNLGTGKARTFNDLVNALFKSAEKEPVIEYIDTPVDIRDKYQYFTEADMNKFLQLGYKKEFYTLEEGVDDYVKDYLMENSYY